MPLINFKTDLTNLPWGRDKRDGGSSKQPYITKDIPEGLSMDDLPVRSGPDFIVRGGLKSVSNALTDVARLAKYLNPLSVSGIKFLAKENLLSKTSVKTQASVGIGYAGATPLFLENESDGVKMGGGANINQGIYTPLSTLGQALGVGLGTHLNLLGLDPTSPMSGIVEGGLFPGSGLTTYESVVGQERNLNESAEDGPNRLVNLQYYINEDGTSSGDKQNILSYNGGPGAILGFGTTRIRFADQRTGAANKSGPGILAKEFQVGYKNYKADSESTAPLGSTPFSINSLASSQAYLDSLGFTRNGAIGQQLFNEPVFESISFPVAPAGESLKTSLRNIQTFEYRVNTIDQNTGLSTPNNNILFDGTLTADGFKSLTYNPLQIAEFDNAGASNRGKTSLYPQDFRKALYTYPNSGSSASENADGTGGRQASKILSLSPDYRTKNKDIRVNQGQPGRSNMTGSIKNVWNYGAPADTLEALDKINGLPMYDGGRTADTQYATNDFVKFRIAAINNDRSDGSAVYMHFRAFLDSFSDSYTSEWNPVSYVGRGDKLYNYGGFGRTINLGFTTMAQSKAELIPMYKKLNYLASTLAPDYTAAGFMRGNLVRLTVGGYLYEQPGFITGLTYDVPQESSWEIGLTATGGADQSVKELPHMIKVSGFSFTPIHTFLPEKPNDANQPNSRFIALTNGINNNYTSNSDYNITDSQYKASGTTSTNTDGDNIPGAGGNTTT